MGTQTRLEIAQDLRNRKVGGNQNDLFVRVEDMQRALNDLLFYEDKDKKDAITRLILELSEPEN